MIFSKFERLMAKRYLRVKRKEGFYFGNYRLCLYGHCAWRGDPDYRDVGDERFP